MKKLYLLLFVPALAIQVLWAASITAPADIPMYWASADGKSGSDLWKAVSSQTSKGYKSIGYDGLYKAYQLTDVYPAGHPDAGKIWDMYGECAFISSNKCGSYKKPCDCYNREHSIPQSWWGGGTGGIGNDIFHVLPTDGKINGVRSNYEYGVVNGGEDWSGNKFGKADSWSTDRKTIASTAGETVSGSGKVFEPKPEYKGDIARGLLGTIIKWQQSSLTTGNNFFNGTYTVSGNFGLTKKAVVLLMKWHREDPVSQKEIDRNNGIQATQGNRNPFIDYPYLAEYIWGEHAGEAVDMSKLVASCDPAFVPGQSDGWSGGSTPIEPGVTYTVTWMANGAMIDEVEVNENAKITALPDAPESCSTESNVFMGWSDATITGTSDDAPAVLYKAVADFPAVTEDQTYYAVFAKAETGGSAVPTSYSFDAEHQDGWSCTATNKGQYWLLDQGKSIESPAIDLMYLNSITVNMRTYGGTQYDELKIAEESGVLTTINATKGSTMSEYTWNNDLYIAGTSKLIFTCSNAGNDKGIGVKSIVINAGGAGTTYDRYITSCQQTTEVTAITTDAPARKVLIGSQLYIIVGEQLYDIQGNWIK